MFDRLKTMETYTLSWNMRNSVEIHMLVETPKEVLSKKETVFTSPDESTTENEGMLSFIDSRNVSPLNSPEKLVLELYQEHELQSVQKAFSVTMGLDEAQAVVGSYLYSETKESITVSNFAYQVVEKTGHKISTVIPALFELGDEKKFHQVLSLVAILQKTLKSGNKHVVLHFDTEPSSALLFVLKHHFKKNVVSKYEEFLSSNNSILVCSYPMFRGLDYPLVTVLIDCNMYFVQHYLVETLARCTSELCIVVLHNSLALEKIARVWKTKMLVDRWQTKIFEKAMQRENDDFECRELHKIITVTFKSKYYKDLEQAY